MIRDKRLRNMCRSMPCQACGADGASAGVTWAHSNLQQHGKGMGLKASDVYVAALCWRCHRELDQGAKMSKEEKKTLWFEAHKKTVRRAVAQGIWPDGVEVPEL